MRGHSFTLIELLAAMAVLVVVMGVLFQFFGSAERAWSRAETNTRIYESARIALGLITRDLQSAVASSRAGAEIPFYVWPGAGGGSGERLSFIARVETNTEAKADLCEIVYAWKDSGANAKELRRARDCDRTSSGVNTDWDFYGKTDAAWASTHAPLQTVIPGVTAFSLICIDRSGAVMSGTSNTLPAAVLVSLTLIDEKLLAAPPVVQDRSKRTFTKTIFLNVQP
jgi:hypothetical protein